MRIVGNEYPQVSNLDGFKKVNAISLRYEYLLLMKEDNDYEKELKRLFLILINDKSVIVQLDEDTKMEFRQLRYRMTKDEVGETTMPKLIEKYMGKRFVIIDNE